MDPSWLIPITGAAAGALAWLLRKLWQKRKQRQQEQEAQNGSGDGGNGNDSEADAQEQARREAQRQDALRKEQRRRENAVKDILNSDNDMAKDLLAQATGMTKSEMREMDDAELVKRIAESVDKNFLEMLKIASKQDDVNISVETTVEKQEVPYPANEIDVVPMTDYGQMTLMMMDDMLLLSDDEFFARLAEMDFLVVRFIQSVIKKKRVYILVDVSGSMGESMSSGVPKHIWARGIILNLMARAIKGDATYFLRPFDGAVHPLMKALNEAEAKEVVNFVLHSGFSGGSTNVMHAIDVAVRDIRNDNKGEGMRESELLLITDAEDSGINTESMNDLLRSDIRVHVCVLGNSSSSLKEVATTYQEIR